ncbi:MAG: MFS transporter, partial [Propionibacteriales bacterium]|nr:MFS transporter [Propionibacteriales bacterium]
MPGARRALLVGMVIRIPMFAATVIMTLHVVSTLQLSYVAAGAVITAATVATAISGPWRGRLLDRIGLRRTVLPSLVVLAVCWSVAPWLGYVPLLVLAGVAGLFVIPTYSIVRQWLIAVTDEADRKTVMVLDSVATELAFMIGPAVGVLLATSVDTRWSLMGAQLLVVIGGLLLFILN